MTKSNSKGKKFKFGWKTVTGIAAAAAVLVAAVFTGKKIKRKSDQQ